MTDCPATAGDAMTDNAAITDSDVIGHLVAFEALKAKRTDLLQKAAEIDKEIAALRLLITHYLNDGEAQKPAALPKRPKAKMRPTPKMKPIHRDRRSMTNREALIGALATEKGALRAPDLIKVAQEIYGPNALNLDSLKTTLRSMRRDREIAFDEAAGTYALADTKNSTRAA